MWEGSFIHWDGEEGRVDREGYLLPSRFDSIEFQDGQRFDELGGH